MQLDDPLTHDETEQFMREDESIREQRWDDFVARLSRKLRPSVLDGKPIDPRIALATMLETVQEALDAEWGAFDDVSCDAIAVCSFAESEGWSGVLIAFAQALRQTERHG